MSLNNWKGYIQDMIDDYGGIKGFLFISLLSLLFGPLVLLYILVLRPTYRGVCVLMDTRELGWKEAYRKHFYPEEYKDEAWEKDYKEMERMNVPLLPVGKYREFKDKKVWPDAYVVDDVAIYANEGRTLLYVHDRVEEFDVPEGVVNIYHRCFMNCDVMKRVSLPSSLRRIGKKSFYSCVALQELVIPESVAIIDEDMLMNCSSLTKVVMPSHITAIPSRMFSQCRSLRDLELPAHVKSIGKEAFRRCYALERIGLNDELKVIMERAFEDCRALKEFIMPDSVEIFQKGFLNGCHALEHIHLSQKVKDFGGSCCHECWNLNSITMTHMTEDEMNFLKEDWEKYGDEVDITKSENPLPESMFWTMGDTLYFGIPRLTSVCLVFCFTKEAEFTIPSFVTNIKREAFVTCRNLRTLRLGPNIKDGDCACETYKVTHGLVYEYWPQIENVIFDESLKDSGYKIGLMA